MQDFQTAASVLKHRLPHSAKPHPRILADAGLSNRSIGAEAPAAAFGKTASADFASAGYNDSRRTGIKEEVLNKA